MTQYERALQGWSVLALAARNRQILTYNIVGKLTGVPPLAVGQLLGPIQAYCQKNSLPPLTAIVVGEETGLPSDGFTATTDVAPAQMRVFAFDWLSRGAPKLEELEQVYKGNPTAA
jgi:hypothetical protein